MLCLAKTNRSETLCLLLCALATGSCAATNDAHDGRAKLEERTFEALSDKTLSDKGRLALKAEDVRWKHGETAHFVYHFPRLTEAQKLSREAEFYYSRIKEDLAVENDLLEGKSHIIMFSRKDQWQVFLADAHLPDWAGAVASGREMFMLVQPGDKDASDRLAHEMTHLVFFRFVPKLVPLWLNEGFAEYESKAAYAKLKGIGLKPSDVARAGPSDLKWLTSLTAYPANPGAVVQFYRESERLVRFLISRHPKGQFVPLVNLLATGASFEEALLNAYAAQYRKLDDFNKKFDRFQ